MISRVILYLIFIVSFLFSNSAYCSTFNINSYNAELNFEKSNIINVKITLNIRSEQSQDFLIFQTGEELKNLVIIIKSIGEKIKFSAISKDSLKIILPYEVKNNEYFDLIFNYDLQIEEAETNLPLYYWYPYAADNLSTWKVKVKIPAGYSFFSPGDTQTNNIDGNFNLMKIIQSKPILQFPFLIAKSDAYKSKTIQMADVKLNFYFLDTSEPFNDTLVNIITGSFSYFNSLLGNYRYDKLDIVEAPGMEYINSQPSVIFAGSIFISKFSNGLNRWPAHETAHQWIGSALFSSKKDNRRTVIFEPMAEYLNLMYMESRYGKDTLEAVLKNLKSEFTGEIENTDMDIPLISAGSSRVIYVKGPVIMHLLREMTGIDNWNSFLKTIYSYFTGRLFTYQDFIECLKLFDKDNTILTNLDKWVTSKGLP